MTSATSGALRNTATGPGSHDAIRNVNAGAFDSLVLNGVGPVAVEFMSYSCAHCGVIEPLLQQVAQSLKSKVAIFRVNVALERELAATYDIEGTPTLILFLDGAEVGRVEGPNPTVASLVKALTEPFES